MPLSVSIVTPEREVFEGEADFVVARAEGGEIGVLPGHAPFLGGLRHAILKIQSGEGSTLYAVHGGFMEVFENHVIVLAPVAEPASEIDVERARRSKEEAEERLNAAAEDEEAQRALLRAETRLRTAAELGLLDVG